MGVVVDSQRIVKPTMAKSGGNYTPKGKALKNANYLENWLGKKPSNRLRR